MAGKIPLKGKPQRQNETLYSQAYIDFGDISGIVMSSPIATGAYSGCSALSWPSGFPRQGNTTLKRRHNIRLVIIIITKVVAYISKARLDL